MKKIITLTLILICFIPLSVFAQQGSISSGWHKIDRLTSTRSGATFYRTQTNARWVASNNDCTANTMRFARIDFTGADATAAENDAYENIYAQLLVALTTGREVRLRGIFCDPNNPAAAIVFTTIDTRETS